MNLPAFVVLLRISALPKSSPWRWGPVALLTPATKLSHKPMVTFRSFIYIFFNFTKTFRAIVKRIFSKKRL